VNARCRCQAARERVIALEATHDPQRQTQTRPAGLGFPREPTIDNVQLSLVSN
jgi:hypothetical protein